MVDRLKWILLLSGCSLVLAVLLQGPNILHQMHPEYRGIYIALNSDEPIYLARIQESLSGRPAQTAEAFTGHSALVGTQFAMIEQVYGALFRHFSWRAGHVVTVFDVVVPVLIFLSLVYFFQLCGFSRRVALLLSVAFCLIELYSLSRPIHMRSSFLVMLWTLNMVILGVMHRSWYRVAAGVLLGLLVGIYVWSFLFAWIFFGIYLLWDLCERSDTRKSLLIIGGVGVLVSLPFVYQYLSLLRHPLYEYGSFRSGMHPSHMPESMIYSGLFFVMILSVCIALKYRASVLRPYKPALVTVLAAFMYMNQQVLHGITFNFVSHGIFSIALGALCIIAIAAVTKSKILSIGALCACIYLAAIAYDGRYVLNQWTGIDSRMGSQHLHTALPILDDMDRSRILSDTDTSAFIAGSTHHDIVYSVYLKNILMTHQEIAMRFCLTLLPLDPALRNIEKYHHLVYPDAVSAFGGDLRQQEIFMVTGACTEMDLDPAISLRVHEVSHIFWNKNTQPQWDVRRLGVKLAEIASTETWVLYRIEQ